MTLEQTLSGDHGLGRTLQGDHPELSPQAVPAHHGHLCLLAAQWMPGQLGKKLQPVRALHEGVWGGIDAGAWDGPHMGQGDRSPGCRPPGRLALRLSLPTSHLGRGCLLCDPGAREGGAGRLLGDPGMAALCLPASPFAFPFPFWMHVSPAPSVGICRAGALAILSTLWTEMPTRLLGVGVLFCGDPSSPRCLRTVEAHPDSHGAVPVTFAHSCTLMHTRALDQHAIHPGELTHVTASHTRARFMHVLTHT